MRNRPVVGFGSTLNGIADSIGAAAVAVTQKGTTCWNIVLAADLYRFHAAIGQYKSYLLALEERDPQRTLYLAVID